MDMKTTSEYMALLRKYMVENAHGHGDYAHGKFRVRLHAASKPKDSDVGCMCVELQTPVCFGSVHIKDRAFKDLFGCAVDIVRLREDMDKLLKQKYNGGRNICIRAIWLMP